MFNLNLSAGSLYYWPCELSFFSIPLPFRSNLPSRKREKEEVENQADWFQGAGPLEGSGSGDTKVLLRSREHLGMEMGLLIESLYK